MPSVGHTSRADDGSKRRKTVSKDQDIGSLARPASASKIFAPFRSLGHVTNEVPFSVSTLGQKIIITTCVGKSFQVYDASTLHLLFVSNPQTDVPIRALETHFHYVYAIWDTKVGIFRRGKLEHVVATPAATPLDHLLVFGEYICVSAGDSILVYRYTGNKARTSPQLYTSFVLPPGAGDVIKVMHPHTYLNKIVVATHSYLLIYNIRTGKLVFQSSPFEIPLAEIAQAPVLDVVGLVFTNGLVQTYNLRQNRVLFELNCKQKICSMSFRTDGYAHLALGTRDGDIYFYDLDRQRRLHILRNVHSTDSGGGVMNIQFLNGQPVFVTAGGDNSLKEFVFDPSMSSSSSVVVISPPRLLRSRSGHALPPTHVKFADNEGHFLLSASLDRTLWAFSLRKDAQSHEFSQRERMNKSKRVAGLTSTLREKFSEITAIAFESSRASDWENVITAHKNEVFARTWSSQSGIVGRWQLRTADKTFVNSVAISHCGNFALTGSHGGAVDVFNLQSGINRKRLKTHSKAVTGVAMDNMNRVIYSCSRDGTFAIHDFKSGMLRAKLALPAAANSMALHKSTELLAIGLANQTIVIIDGISSRLVRTLAGHKGAITAYDFSADGRWIVSASADHTIRTFDLPTGCCIDAMMVESPVRSLCLSGNEQWLVTAHDNGVGLNIWTNRTLFTQVPLRKLTSHEEDDVMKVNMPSISLEPALDPLEGVNGVSREYTRYDREDSGVYISPGQLDSELVTLSSQPRTKYVSMVNIDIIKRRNKPTSAPKPLQNAPFFLNNEEDVKSKEGEKQRTRYTTEQLTRSEFGDLLRESHELGNNTAFIEHLKGLSPAQTDLEISALKEAEKHELTLFVDAMTNHMSAHIDYELVQAWMSIFLKHHGDLIVRERDQRDLQAALISWKNCQISEKRRINDLIGYCNGVVSFLRL
ncbi:Utp21 specific WD40 associated putative domain-containing protein [Dipodascopsis tothii]|uniref:Utp21 specific WD40 associated putative domain-containing protein n=1 Tax=Dipodascopsis tothii TaxID=44089 RepID=UPI0034CE9051